MGGAEQDMIMLSPLFSAGSHVLNAVDSGALHPALLKTFMLLPRTDQKAFLTAFDGAGLSFQTQREFLEWLTELSYTERLPVAQILGRQDIRSIVHNTRLNWPQRIEKIRNILYERRYPRLSAARELWKKNAAAANPSPSSIQFIPSPFFEKNKLEVRCTLTDPAAARDIFTRLALVPPETWHTLIYPLHHR